MTLIFIQVVELLLSKGANKEHRNVSDYTPLSLAASGGYVNIIKLLLHHGAEINSRYLFLILPINFTFVCHSIVKFSCTVFPKLNFEGLGVNLAFLL